MKKEQLERFVKISRCKTVEEASQRLGVPEAKIGTFIATLEEEIGCTLFHKKAQGLEMTGYGRVLRERAPHIILELRHLDEGLEAERQRHALSIHFSFFAAPHCFMLMPQIAQGLDELLFTASVQATRYIIEDMERGNVHIGIMPAESVPEGYKSVELFKEQAYLSVPFSSALSGKEKLTLEDVASEPIYMVSDLYGVSQWYEKIYAAAGGDISRAQRPEVGDYLLGANSTPRNHLSTNVMQMLGNAGAQRVEIPIDADIARRSIVVTYQERDAKHVQNTVNFILANKDMLYSSHAFLPYLLGPGQAENLLYVNV